MAMCEPFPEGLFEEQQALKMPATYRPRGDTSVSMGNEEVQEVERQYDSRRHSSASSGKGGVLHSAAEKLREAKAKLKKSLSGEDEDIITDEKIAKAAKKRDELKEKERTAERRASDAAEKYDRLLQKKMQQRCHEADQQANQELHSNAMGNFVSTRVTEIH